MENAFGILAQRWHCFNRRLQLKTETVVKIVQATCVLHNYLRVPTDATITATYARLNPDRLNYLGPDGAIVDLQNLNGYRSAQEAQQIRDKFLQYFNSQAGALAYQDEQLRR